jgi:hypothetical protein
MRDELAATAPTSTPADDGSRRLRAFGLAYVRFALAEPGLFRSAFHRSGSDGDHTAYPAYRALAEAIDAMAAFGLVRSERRAAAVVVYWAAVHGLAVLLLDGLIGTVAGDAPDVLVVTAVGTVLEALTTGQEVPGGVPVVATVGPGSPRE